MQPAAWAGNSYQSTTLTFFFCLPHCVREGCRQNHFEENLMLRWLRSHPALTKSVCERKVGGMVNHPLSCACSGSITAPSTLLQRLDNVGEKMTGSRGHRLFQAVGFDITENCGKMFCCRGDVDIHSSCNTTSAWEAEIGEATTLACYCPSSICCAAHMFFVSCVVVAGSHLFENQSTPTETLWSCQQ